MYSSPIVVLAGIELVERGADGDADGALRESAEPCAAGAMTPLRPGSASAIRSSVACVVPSCVFEAGAIAPTRSPDVRIDAPGRRYSRSADRFVLIARVAPGRDRIEDAVDPQVDIGKRLAVSDQESRRDQRLEFAAGLVACFQRGDQPAPRDGAHGTLRKLAPSRPAPRPNARCWRSRRSRGHALRRFSGLQLAPVNDGRPPLAVDDARAAASRGAASPPTGASIVFRRLKAAAQQIERKRPEPRVRPVLGQRGADAGRGKAGSASRPRSTRW